MSEKKTKLIPTFKEIIGDLETPVTAYLKLDQANSFLLESVEGGESVARYSYIGIDPFCSLITIDGKTKITRRGHSEETDTNAIDSLEELVGQFTIEESDEFPRLVGGAVGFFSWETIADIENIQLKNKTKSEFPLAHFLFPRSMVIFDHVQRKITLLTLTEEGHESEADAKINEMEKALQKVLTVTDLKTVGSDKDPFEIAGSNYEKKTYESHVEQIKKHIYEGDVFQLVLSQKFKVESKKDPFNVYRSLRYINPSPYMFYFNYGDYQVIGSSPEILVRLEGDKATVKPIAGTRKRKINQDEEQIKDLLADEKERAEHIMLVDLGRNDLGRVCDYDSIKTSNMFAIEKYSHVIHMVTSVEGKLRSDKNAFDLFKATFPAGTLSGAPKIRAIEIIEDMEPEQRGPYGGALGYFDLRGNMDLCIIIRTIIAKNKNFYVQAGAGIVADSVPEREYVETQSKARGMIAACLE